MAVVGIQGDCVMLFCHVLTSIPLPGWLLSVLERGLTVASVGGALVWQPSCGVLCSDGYPSGPPPALGP